MSKQDRQGVRTPVDIERKYDLASLVGIKKAVENSVDGLNKTNTTLEEFMRATLGTLDNMQSQIDGNITTWFSGGVPTLSTYPASDWESEEIKTNHIGDLYYDQDTGYAYRFAFSDGKYQWMKIVDNDVVEALALANAASDTADSKRRVFTAKPVPPYDSGDLWFYNGEIYICQISKGENEAYAEKDFIIATKYTDDTYAKQVGDELTVVKGTVTTIKESMDSYKVEISTKINTVEKELEVANTAITANTQEIDLRVKKDGVIGAINVSNEAVKISANKIDIEGAVTFSALATDVSNKINTASTNASAAVTTANSTATAVASATATANAALSTANTASSNASTALATANAAKTLADANDKLLLSWCAENDKTLIDGGKIYAEDLYAIGAKIGGWSIERSGLSKSSPQPSVNTFGPAITANKPEYSSGATRKLSFNEKNTQIAGLMTSELDYYGIRFRVASNSDGMGIEYSGLGIGVASSADDIANDNYKAVMTFSDENVWAKKISTENIVCKGEVYTNEIYTNNLVGVNVKSVAGADLDEINSNLSNKQGAPTWLTSDNVDNVVGNNANFNWGYGLIDNQGYFSITMGWIAIQFRTQGFAIQKRSRYGSTGWSAWSSF